LTTRAEQLGRGDAVPRYEWGRLVDAQRGRGFSLQLRGMDRPRWPPTRQGWSHQFLRTPCTGLGTDGRLALAGQSAWGFGIRDADIAGVPGNALCKALGRGPPLRTGRRWPRWAATHPDDGRIACGDGPPKELPEQNSTLPHRGGGTGSSVGLGAAGGLAPARRGWGGPKRDDLRRGWSSPRRRGKRWVEYREPQTFTKRKAAEGLGIVPRRHRPFRLGGRSRSELDPWAEDSLHPRYRRRPQTVRLPSRNSPKIWRANSKPPMQCLWTAHRRL